MIARLPLRPPPTPATTPEICLIFEMDQLGSVSSHLLNVEKALSFGWEKWIKTANIILLLLTTLWKSLWS